MYNVSITGICVSKTDDVMKMERTSIKIYAVLGTIFVCFPILFSLLTSITGTIRDKAFRFDFLIPMEFFALTIVSGTFIT